MIIIDILNPDESDEPKKKETKEIKFKQEDLKKIPRTSLQIISIDGKIISQ